MGEAEHKFTNSQLINLLKDKNPKVKKFTNRKGGKGSSRHNSLKYRYSLQLGGVVRSPANIAIG